MMEDHLIENNNGLNGMSADDGGSLDLDETEDRGSVGSDTFTTPLAQYKPHDDHLGLRRRRRTNVSYYEETHIENDDHFPVVHWGPNAFAQFKPHDGFLGSQGKGYVVLSSKADIDKVDIFTEEAPLKYKLKSKKIFDDLIRRLLAMRPPPKGPSPNFDLISKFLNYVSLGGPMIDQIFQTTLKKPVALLLNKPFDDHFGLRQRRIQLSSRGGTLDFISWFRDDDYLLHRLIDLVKEVDVVSQMISSPTVIAAAGIDCNLNLDTASVVTARHTEQRITPSSPSLMNTPHRIDIPGGNSNDERKGWSQKMDFEWIFVITNIVLESMSAIFTQLSSKQNPQYALFGMLLSYLALLTCITELIYEGHRHRQIPIWRRRRGTWYYDRPQRRKSFATLNNIVALACALGQCVVTTINYRFDNPIKVTVLPIILVFGVLFSKTLKYRQREAL